MAEDKVTNGEDPKEYRKKIYTFLSDNFSDFKTPEVDFYSKLDKDPEYAGKVWGVISDNFSDFKRPKEEFISLMGPGPKKKDLFGGVTTYAGQLAKGVGEVVGKVGRGLETVARASLEQQRKGGEKVLQPTGEMLEPEMPKEGFLDSLTYQQDIKDPIGNLKRSLIKPSVPPLGQEIPYSTYVRMPESQILKQSDKLLKERSENVEKEKAINQLKLILSSDSDEAVNQLSRTTGIPAQDLKSLSKNQLRSLDVSGNETNKIAVNSLLNAIDVKQAITNAKSISQAALNYELNRDPEKAKRYAQGVQFSPKVMGKMVFDFINNPSVDFELKNTNPKLHQEYVGILDNFLENYPEYGAVIVGNKVSRGYEKQKDWYENLGVPAAFVKDDLDDYAKSSLPPKEYEVYSKYIKGNEEDYIDTPSLFEGVAGGGKGVFKGFFRSVAEPFVGAKESDIRKWEEEASNVSADPEGVSKWLRESGHVIGLVGALAGTGGVLRGAGMSAKAANALNVGTAFFGDQLKLAKEKFPDSPVKYTTDALINTALFVALGQDIFPSDKVAQALKGVRPEIGKIVENLANGSINREIARQQANTIYKKAFDALSAGLKQNVKVSAELTGIAALNRGLDKLFGMDSQKYEKYHPKDEEAQTFKTMFLSNAFISGLAGYGAVKGKNRIAMESYYEAASNPERFKKIIDFASEINPEINKQEMLANLNFLADIKKTLDARDMSPENQKRYLASAIKAKTLQEAAKVENDNVLKKQKEQEVADLTKEREDILSGVAPEIEVKEEEVVGPTIEGEVSEETLNKYLSNYKRQQAQRRKELTEQGVKDVEGDEQLKEIQDKIANIQDKLSKLAGLKPGEVAPEVPAAAPVPSIIKDNFENREAIEEKLKDFGSGLYYHGSNDISYLNNKNDIKTLDNTKNAKSKYLNLSPKPSTAISYSISQQTIGENSGVAAFKLKGKGYTMKNSDIQSLKTNQDYENFYDRKKSEGYDYVKVPQDANDIVVLNNDAIDYVGKKLNIESIGSVKPEAKPEVPAKAPVPSIIEVKSPKEVKQGDTVVWRGEDFTVEEVNSKGGFNLRNLKDRTNTVTDARITDAEFQGKRGEVPAEAATEVPLAKPEVVSEEVMVERPASEVAESFKKDYNEGKLQKGKEYGGSRNLGIFDYANRIIKVVKEKRRITEEQVRLMAERLGDMVNVTIPESVIDLGRGRFGVVMKKAKGVDASKLTQQEIDNIPQEHWDKFENDIKELSKRGVAVDMTKRDNFFYDKDSGFSFLDISGISVDGSPTNKFFIRDGVEYYYPFEQYPAFAKKSEGGKKMFENIKKELAEGEVFEPKFPELPKEEKKKEDAVQVETTGEVPVQPEARVSIEMEEGVPGAKPKEVAEEGKVEGQEGEVTPPVPPAEAPRVELPRGGEERKKAFLNAILGAKGTPEAAKEGMRREGLNYKTSSQNEARELANSIVEELGIDEALDIARKQELYDGDVNAFIMGRVLEKLADLEAAATSPQEKQKYAERFAETAIAQDEMARFGGRFNAAIGAFYKKSPLGVVLYENAKRQENFTDWSRNKEESWKDFYARLMEEPEFAEVVGKEVSEKVKAERAQERAAKKEKAYKAIDNGIAKVKDLIKKNLTAELPEGTKKMGVSIDVDKILDAAGEVMKKAYDAGETVKEAVQKAIDYISAQVGNDKWGVDEFRKSAEESLGSVEGKGKKYSEEAYRERLKKQIKDIDEQLAEMKRKPKAEKEEKEYQEETKKLIEERNEKKKQLDEAIPVTREISPESILKRIRKKLNGLNEKEKKEVVRNSFNKIIESGGLDFQEFRDIIAKVTGRGELTAEQAAKIKELVDKTNSVEAAAQRARELRTPQAFKEYKIVQLEAARAAAELNDMLDTKVNISDRINSLIQLNTLGAVTLALNPLLNIVNQIGVRFPAAVQSRFIDAGLSAAAKAVGMKYEADPSVLSLQAQKEYFKNLGLGLNEAGQQFWTGLNRQDYTQREITTQKIRPLDSWKALFNIARRKRKASTKEVIDKALQALPGAPAEIVARSLNLGDKPFRFGTEALWGSAFAKKLGLTDIDYTLFLEFPREEAYRAYKKQGLSDKEAAEKADYVKDVIIKEGKKATFTQDNFLNNFVSALFENKMFKGTGGVLKTLVISPYIKVPANIYWSYYNIVNPEVAMLQAMYYGGRAAKQSGNARKMSLRDARYWFGHATVGIATRAVIWSLVQAGIAIPGSDKEETKKEREGKRQFVQPGTINIDKLRAFVNGENPDEVKGGLEIPFKYWGHFGQVANTIGKQYEDMTPEQREAKRDFWDDAFGKLELEALKEMESGIFSNASSLLSGVFGEGTFDLRRYGINTLNLLTNIVQPATMAQISRAELPYQSTARADNFLQEIKNTVLQRSSMFRKLSKSMPPAKIGIWGDVLTKEGGEVQKILGISRANDDAFAAPVWELYSKTGDIGYFPAAILPVLGNNKLNTEQLIKLQQYAGAARKERIRPIVNDEADVLGFGVKFSELDDADKKMVLNYEYELGKKIGEEKLYKEYPELAPKEKDVDILKKIQKELFMSLEKYR